MLSHTKEDDHHLDGNDNSGTTAVIHLDPPDPEPEQQRWDPTGIINKARQTFETGLTKDIEFRRQQLRSLIAFLDECREGLVAALHADLHKPRQESITSDIDIVANDARHTLMELGRWTCPQHPPKRLINLLDTIYTQPEPYGVVLIIGAWNYPVLLTLGPLVGCIAAGNCAILKPSELAFNTAHFLASNLCRYLHRPAVQVVVGGPEHSGELLRHQFDYIFFTGSTAVGRLVHAAAAQHLTPTTLELGGKCPVYIDDTVPMSRAVRRILWGKFLNAGQTCISPDYVMCTAQVAATLVSEARKTLLQFYGIDQGSGGNVGGGGGGGVVANGHHDKVPLPHFSRIINRHHYERLTALLEGVTVAVGGHRDAQHLFLGPTIVTGVRPTDRLMREEIFGPILPIMEVTGAEHALKVIRSANKPLAAYVFSNNTRVQRMFIEHCSSGCVTINDTVLQIATEGLPFGGVGQSGMGTYHGRAGFETFSHRKGVLKRSLGPLAEMATVLRYPPYSDRKTTITSIAMKRRWAGPRRSWLRALLFILLGVVSTLVIQRVLQQIDMM